MKTADLYVRVSTDEQADKGYSQRGQEVTSTLRKLGVEPQAIEQPLDLSIPENKMMLAFYLATPEVENDRRALNTIYGMRRALKEGRYRGLAPIGYLNRITESGRKYIALDQPQARLLKAAFEEVATGIYTVEEVRKRAVRRGLKCAKTTFWRALENPVYFGMIEVKGYRDEKTTLVDGQHEALISEKLFYDIQDAIGGKRKRQRPNVKELSNAAFELRGFLQCPKCGKVLTASASTRKERTLHLLSLSRVLRCSLSSPGSQ